MSYHIYTTEGIILKRTPFGEANILISVLTYDFGLIKASARSARLSTSKLRPALQEYSFVIISCVKGKGGWKITNVSVKENSFFNHPQYIRRVVAQVASVLLKMIQGEDPHKEVFQIIKSGFEYLKDISEEKVENFEILIVLRVMFELGYVAKTEDLLVFLDSREEWNEDVLQKVGSQKKFLISLINKALSESHL